MRMAAPFLGSTMLPGEPVKGDVVDVAAAAANRPCAVIPKMARCWSILVTVLSSTPAVYAIEAAIFLIDVYLRRTSNRSDGEICLFVKQGALFVTPSPVQQRDGCGTGLPTFAYWIDHYYILLLLLICMPSSWVGQSGLASKASIHDKAVSCKSGRISHRQRNLNLRRCQPAASFSSSNLKNEAENS